MAGAVICVATVAVINGAVVVVISVAATECQ